MLIMEKAGKSFSNHGYQRQEFSLQLAKKGKIGTYNNFPLDSNFLKIYTCKILSIQIILASSLVNKLPLTVLRNMKWLRPEVEIPVQHKNVIHKIQIRDVHGSENRYMGWVGSVDRINGLTRGSRPMGQILKILGFLN